MKKYYTALLYINQSTIAVLYIQKYSPTKMAGPGLDILVYIISIIVGIVLFAKSLKKVQSGNRSSYILFFINAVGLLVISIAVYYTSDVENIFSLPHKRSLICCL